MYMSDDSIADRLEDEHLESGATSYEQRHSIEFCTGCTDTVCCDAEGTGYIAMELYCESCFEEFSSGAYGIE